jgi:hypothetical protein
MRVCLWGVHHEVIVALSYTAAVFLNEKALRELLLRALSSHCTKLSGAIALVRF